MINPFASIFLASITITIGLIFLIGYKKTLYSLATIFGIIALIFSSSLPVMAVPNLNASRSNDTQVQEPNTCQFKESCLCTNSEFKGLCVAQGQNGSQSDDDIIKAIKSQASDDNNLIVHVDNGAVMLSGSVKDEETARTLIKEVEQLPGVHYITVELGLINQTNRELS